MAYISQLEYENADEKTRIVIDEWVSVDVRRGKDVTWLNELIKRED